MAKKVLVVDDSLFTRNMMKDIVLNAGVDIVITAEGGKEALQKFEEEQPDIVFMDIMMPEINGIDTLKEIIKIDKSAKVVMFSSAQQGKVINEALDAGALDFIPKPIKKSDVISIIEKYL